MSQSLMWRAMMRETCPYCGVKKTQELFQTSKENSFNEDVKKVLEDYLKRKPVPWIAPYQPIEPWDPYRPKITWGTETSATHYMEPISFEGGGIKTQ